MLRQTDRQAIFWHFGLAAIFHNIMIQLISSFRQTDRQVSRRQTALPFRPSHASIAVAAVAGYSCTQHVGIQFSSGRLSHCCCCYVVFLIHYSRKDLSNAICMKWNPPARWCLWYARTLKLQPSQFRGSAIYLVYSSYIAIAIRIVL